jgi:hypothetical protein
MTWWIVLVVLLVAVAWWASRRRRTVGGRTRGPVDQASVDRVRRDAQARGFDRGM